VAKYSVIGRNCQQRARSSEADGALRSVKLCFVFLIAGRFAVSERKDTERKTCATPRGNDEEKGTGVINAHVNRADGTKEL
jgi:hypothetical protein